VTDLCGGAIAVWCVVTCPTQNIHFVLGSTGAYVDILRGAAPRRYSLVSLFKWLPKEHTPLAPREAAQASQELFYRIKVAEQDNLADVASLVALPAITTMLVLLGHEPSVLDSSQVGAVG